MAVNPGFPKTAAQRHFEEFSSILLKIMAELTEEDRSKIFNYAVNLYNEKMEVKTR